MEKQFAALLRAVEEVIEWHAQTGGWEAPCWVRLSKAYRQAQKGKKSEESSEAALKRVFDVLYLDRGPDGEFHNQDKEWDSGTIEAVDDIVRPCFANLLQSAKKDTTAI